jgi:ubiquinone/menaquinone biosynthesis C-methylase UbiE
MDTATEAADYDAIDHREVNSRFVADLLAAAPPPGEVLDLGCGTAQILVELCRQSSAPKVVGVDLSANMLELGKKNVAASGFTSRIRLERVDAKELPYGDGRFAVVISNSIVHHIPEPAAVLADAWRVLAPGGLVFVRDLLRPADRTELDRLVELYTVGSNANQRQLFAQSLHAALALDEVRELVAALGVDRQSVQQTSDRHRTWSARKKPR